MNPGIYLPQGLPQSLATPFVMFFYPFGLSYMLFLFSYFLSELFSFAFTRSFVSVFLHRLVDRIFFRSFRRSCFDCIGWICPGIFQVSFFRQYFSFISFSCIVSLVWCRLFLSFHSIVFLRIFHSYVFSLIIVSLFVFLATFPIQLLYFCLGFLVRY